VRIQEPPRLVLSATPCFGLRGAVLDAPTLGKVGRRRVPSTPCVLPVPEGGFRRARLVDRARGFTLLGFHSIQHEIDSKLTPQFHGGRSGASRGPRNKPASAAASSKSSEAIRPLDPTLTPPDITTFRHWELGEDIQVAIAGMGITTPSPIQRLAIGPVLAGKDVIAKAETGTGKTLAFGAPMMAKIDPARASVLGLVMCPTRELAEQVQKVLTELGKPRGIEVALIVGGEPMEPQVKALKRGAQVVVGTPGRILDLYKQKFLSFPWTEFAILDEADVMFEFGFIDDVKEILSYTPDERQTLLFSATFPVELLKLARENTRDPAEVATAAGLKTVDNIEQSVIFLDDEDRTLALMRLIENSDPEDTFLVFCPRRTDVDKLIRRLERMPFGIKALHGGYDQAARFRVMAAFRTGEVKALIATDVASRGLDVKHVSTVVNYGSPHDITDYTHRIGRTGRAGRKGRAITLVGGIDRRKWTQIEREATWKIPEVDPPLRGERPRPRVEEAPREDVRDAAVPMPREERATGRGTRAEREVRAPRTERPSREREPRVDQEGERPRSPAARAPRARPTEARAERPRVDAPREEGSQREPTRARAPRGESPRTASPRPESTHAEAMRAESTRAEATRAESTRSESRRTAAPRSDVSRGETPRSGASRGESARSETSRGESSGRAAPRTESARGATSRSAPSRAESARGEAPRSSAPRADAAPTSAARRAPARSEAPREESPRGLAPRSEPRGSDRTRDDAPRHETGRRSESTSRAESQPTREPARGRDSARHSPETRDSARGERSWPRDEHSPARAIAPVPREIDRQLEPRPDDPLDRRNRPLRERADAPRWPADDEAPREVRRGGPVDLPREPRRGTSDDAPRGREAAPTPRASPAAPERGAASRETSSRETSNREGASGRAPSREGRGVPSRGVPSGDETRSRETRAAPEPRDDRPARRPSAAPASPVPKPRNPAANRAPAFDAEPTPERDFRPRGPDPERRPAARTETPRPPARRDDAPPREPRRRER